MLRQKMFFFIIFIFSVFFATVGYSQEAVTKLREYGIDELDKVKMSYRHDGAYSPFKYNQVEIQGDGKAICSFQYRNLPEQVSQLQLEKSFIEELIRLYAKLDFFEFRPQDITESFVYDAGETTLSFQFKDRRRTINYAAIKTKSKGRLAIPATPQGELLHKLHSMYWKITSQKTYLYNLKDYQNKDIGVLASLLSDLEADVREKRVLNPQEFLSIIMEIISHKELRDSIGQYAASALEQITGEKPPGDWWDCERWLKWWQANKDKYNIR